MNCSHVQNLMSAFIDCELAAEEKRELRQHLFYCAECGAAYQELLEFKEYLQNIAIVPLNFDPLQDLHLRLSNEEHSIARQFGRFFWIGRVGLVAACLGAFFLSTYILFPANQSSGGRLAAKTNNTNTVRFTPAKVTPVTFDQDFSIDRPVTVYQASFMLP